MRLDMVTIENFRSIKNATVKFNEITALVGENNAGKTAILRALNSVFNYSFEEEFFENSTHRFMPRTVTKITLIFKDIPEKSVYEGKTFNGELKLKFQYSYSNSKHGKTLYCVINKVMKQVDESFIDDLKNDIDFVYIPANRGSHDLQWGNNSILSRVVTTYFEEYTKNRDSLSKQVIGTANKIRTQVLTKLEKELSDMNLLSEIGDYHLKFQDELDYRIYLELLKLYLPEGGNDMPVTEFGSGVKSQAVIAMHRMLAKMNNVSIILGIEEPETNLHPQAQKKFIASLKNNRQSYETQAIFATHSTVIVDSLDHQDIVLVKRNNDEKRGFYSSVSQLENDFWEKHNIEDYKHYNFFKYKNSDFFFAKYVVITESITDSQVVERMLTQKIGDKLHYVSILNLDGVKNLKYPYFLLKDLSIPFSMIVDKDTFVSYKNGSLEKSRDKFSCLPLYSESVNFKNPVLKSIFNTPKLQNELETHVNESYNDFIEFIMKYNIYSMQYCLEMDLVNTTKGKRLYYDYFGISEDERKIYKLLVERKKEIKDPKVLLDVFNKMKPNDYPTSFKKIRKNLANNILSTIQ